MDDRNELNELLSETKESNTKKYLMAVGAVLVIFFVAVAIMKFLNSSPEEDTTEKNVTNKTHSSSSESAFLAVPVDANKSTDPYDKVIAKVQNGNMEATPPQTSVLEEPRESVAVTKASNSSSSSSVVQKIAPSLAPKPEHKEVKPKTTKEDTKPQIHKPEVAKKVVQDTKNQEQKTQVHSSQKISSSVAKHSSTISSASSSVATSLVSSASKGSYYIQVGSFSNEPTTKFIESIKSLGFSHSTKVVEKDGVKTHKVMVGPFKSKADAVANVQKIRDNVNSGAFIAQ